MNKFSIDCTKDNIICLEISSKINEDVADEIYNDIIDKSVGIDGPIKLLISAHNLKHIPKGAEKIISMIKDDDKHYKIACHATNIINRSIMNIVWGATSCEENNKIISHKLFEDRQNALLWLSDNNTLI